MKCSEAQDRLSAYVDNELPADLCEQVAAHVSSCSACAAKVEFARELAGEVRAMPAPAPPPGLWEAIEARLENEEQLSHVGDTNVRRWWATPRAAWAIAASVLLALTAGLLATNHFAGDHGHETMAANFDLYLAKFAVDPEQAHQTLVATYNGQLITPEEAEKSLGFRPVATSTAGDFTVEQTYALEMPCCRCSLSVCRRADGGVMTVLEHVDPQPMWFGDRSRVECICGGKPTSVVELSGQLAASWRQGERQITVIGAGDLEEVTRLVDSLSKDASG
ncbi:anti-sigma factor family protein [Aeoliella sp.]|uniref:anti-sigma factor family protein n=1 Tax=Aeoliella sp. TaxID=2795800 RepID=UPI003CCC013D